jgi:hypothetical protein
VREAFPMPGGTRKRHWLIVVTFLGADAIGMGIGLLVGYALGRAHTEETDRLNRFPCALNQPELLNDYLGN